MLIYTIIVTFNGQQWIERCLSSVLSSSIPLKCIVIDNGSTDNTVKIIETKFSNVELVKANSNLGFGAANNVGIRKAIERDVDYVFLLNQDAWIESDTIEKLIKASIQEPQYGVVSPMHLNGRGDALDYNFSIYVSPFNCKNLFSDVYLNSISKKIYPLSFVNAAAWLITKDCVTKVGGFNPAFFHYGEDDNYVHRLHYHNFKIGVLAITQIYHDRSYRIGNTFSTHLNNYKRKIYLDFSNPRIKMSHRKELLKKLLQALKEFVLLKKQRFRLTSQMIKFLLLLNKKMLIHNRTISMAEEKPFL